MTSRSQGDLDDTLTLPLDTTIVAGAGATHADYRAIYGILIQMFYNDHEPPHFHAYYGGAKAIIRIADGVVISGDLPSTAQRMLRRWALARSAELQDNWQRARTMQPLEKVAGPDDE